MHDGQLDLDLATAAALIGAQFPQWASLPVRVVESSGTVNTIVRIGDCLAARFPLLGDDPDDVHRTLEAEAAAARRIARSSPVPTPEPRGIGRPGLGYPLPWSVQTWLPGTVASTDSPGDSAVFARDLGGFLTALRAADTGGLTFAGAGRGGDLRTHDGWMATCFARSGHLLDVPLLRALWADLRALPREGPDVMTHGDLIPGNVLVAGDRLAGVLDVGGYGPADPALDLVAGWHLLDDGPRRALRSAVGSSDLEWERGKAWAFVQAMGAVWYYVESNRTMFTMGVRALQRITRDTVGAEVAVSPRPTPADPRAGSAGPGTWPPGC